MSALQQQRVVDNKHVRAPVDGVIDDGIRGL